ncbi:MAG: hypothetical protein FJ280_03855 [Planctomycetes bacterium]|nr:hypothetical protein [Planctomycetota bacterium]
MYYHYRPLLYVLHDKVHPCNPATDFLVAYRWLEYYCGFCPQIWLSRSHSHITGVRRPQGLKGSLGRGSDRTAGWRTELKRTRDGILLGFEHVRGFPVSFDIWETFILNGLLNPASTEDADTKTRLAAAIADPAVPFPKPTLDRRLVASLNHSVDGDAMDEIGDLPAGDTYGEALRHWQRTRDLDTWLGKVLFTEVDQVVVPSLNLKTAKRLTCRDERQKRILRQRGFIEDRIEIRNLTVASR